MISSKKRRTAQSPPKSAILRSAYSGFCWFPPIVRRLFEVNSEPHTGARPSVRLCVGLITWISPNITQYHPISLEYHMDITEYHPISHGYHTLSLEYHPISHGYHMDITEYHPISHGYQRISLKYQIISTTITEYHQISPNLHGYQQISPKYQTISTTITEYH